MNTGTLGATPLSTPIPQRGRLRVSTKLAYGLGSVAYGIKDNGFSTLLLLFYNQVVGLPADLVGLAIMIALVFDAFIDPIIGHLSDQTRTRWGRRHPFMYASAIPVGLLYLLLWNPPRGSHLGTLAYLVGVAILVRTAISFYEVPSAALAPELTSDYHERTSVLGYRYLFGWIGGMGMVLLTFVVFLRPNAAFPVGQLNPAGYRTYAFVASALMSATILVSALGTHARATSVPRLPGSSTSFAGTARAIAASLRNRAFACLMAAGIFGFTAQGLTFALSTYLNTFFWQFPASVLAVFVFATVAGVAASFALATGASKRWGKRRTSSVVTASYPVVAIAPYLLRIVGAFPANDSAALLPLLLVSTFVSTALGVAGAILSASMMADVAEDSQTRTGERREGIFFAGSFFVQKCVSGLGLFLSGLILALVAFPTGAVPGRVPLTVLNDLALIYSGGLVALAGLAAIFLWHFPLGDQREHEARLAQLAEDSAITAALPGSEPTPLPVTSTRPR